MSKKQDTTWATNGDEELEDILLQALERPIAYHRIFRAITGSTVAAILLSQAWYWSPRATRRDKFFWKTQHEWEEETGLTRREQETARTVLTNLGFIEEKRRGIPARMHFKVNTQAICNAIVQYVRLSQSSMAEDASL